MSNIKTGDILNFDYTGAVQSVTLPKGVYKLECWGAQGGNGYYSDSSISRTASFGGYSTGIINLNKPTTIYVYVGGAGTKYSTNASGGFNGGGACYSSNGRYMNSGGGGTDIRVKDDSLYSRVIVAGGGGGCYETGTPTNYSCSGGGESGIVSNGSGSDRYGQPGTQTTGGAARTTTSWDDSYSHLKGIFGIGGGSNGISMSYINGGGGGWYGGGAGGPDGGAGGGSGYVYTRTTSSNYPSGCLLNSSYYLTDAKTIAGNNSFVSPTGSSETGHSGNGYCRITVIKCKSTALYTRINNSMKKATAFYFKLNNNKMYGVGSASPNSQNSTIMNFSYTGSVQTVTLAPGEYKLECWGASGGDAANATYNGGTGGKGGYSFGMLKISSTSKYHIIVGGQGQSYNTSLNKKYAGAGGFGGGGAGGAAWMSGDVSGGAGGGGLSGIFTSTTYNGNEIIIAGGGGGGGGSASSNGSGHYHGSNGGAGGGLTGKDGVYNLCGTMSISHKNNNVGRGGSQTAGGVATNQNSIAGGKLYGGGGGGCSSGASGNSTTLSGGAAQTSSNSSSSAGGSGGGGGGYYGGSGGGEYGQGAGGGSGYINPVLKNSNLIAGDQSFPAPSGSTETGHSGNGYVRITKTDVIYLTHANNDIMDFYYTGSTQSKTLKPGTYTIECWGGQGGSYSGCIGGYGGYSKGTITLIKATTIYVSVGGAGSSSSTTAGFNGGGAGISSGRGGGGATDVRIGQNSLYSRVIVAGGGGGAGVTGANANPCGCGGGEYGGDGYYNDTSGSYTTGQNRCGGSASQTAGGITWSTGAQATFGQGGKASGYSCGGGGGGWYGGGGAYDNDSDSDGRWGGGGSGYVYTSSTAKNYPNGCLLNSTYYLTNAQTIAGNTSFTSPAGSAETGHTGNGFCRITNLNPTQYGLYVKTNSGWKHIDL